MALLILALLQRIFLMSSLMLLLVWLIFLMVLIKLVPILVTISGKTVKLMVFFLKHKAEYELGLGIPADPLFRSEIAEMQNETQKEIAGIQSATSRQNTK